MEHIDDHDLERYYLGMVHGRELSRMEKHLLWCDACVHHAYIAQDYIDAMRAAIIQGTFDVDWLARKPVQTGRRI